MIDVAVDVLVAGYQDAGAARREFDGLLVLVKSKRVKAEGVILVGHDQDGNSIVMDQAGPHTITAANPPPDGQGQALEAITSVS